LAAAAAASSFCCSITTLFSSSDRGSSPCFTGCAAIAGFGGWLASARVSAARRPPLGWPLFSTNKQTNKQPQVFWGLGFRV
jgi:hypothetical protein